MKKSHIFFILLVSMIVLAACKDSSSSNVKEKTENKLNIVGTWYSDNPKSNPIDTLTLNKDMTFDGSLDLKSTNTSGHYEYVELEKKVILTTAANKKYVLTVTNDSLEYDKGLFSLSFYNDKSIAEAKMKNRNMEIIDELSNLLIGTWNGSDQFFNNIMTFNEDQTFSWEQKFIKPSVGQMDKKHVGTYEIVEYKDINDIALAQIILRTGELEQGVVAFRFNVNFNDDMSVLRLNNIEYKKGL